MQASGGASTVHPMHRVSDWEFLAALTRWCRQLEALATRRRNSRRHERRFCLEMEPNLKKSGGLLRQGKPGEGHLSGERAVPRFAGLAKWVLCLGSARGVEAVAGRSLLKEIQAVTVSVEAYGSPRITRELRAGGTQWPESCGRMESKVRRRYRVTTQAGDRAPAKSLLNRDFKASERTGNGSVTSPTFRPERWLYLAVIIDLYSRAVVGWSMNSWISQELVLDALKMAVGRRRSRV